MIKSKLKNRNISQEDVFNFSELFKLMKPRVMSLVIFTCAVGLLMAPNIVPTKDAIIAIILVSIGAGAAGVSESAELSAGKEVMCGMDYKTLYQAYLENQEQPTVVG